MIEAFGLSDVGRVRKGNEDSFACDESLRLFIVADGMGGHNAGEVASRLAVEAMVGFIKRTAGEGEWSWPYGVDPNLSYDANRLRTAIHVAHVQVLQAAAVSRHCSGMGTTIVAAVVDGNRLSVGHVGDSRLYLVAGDGIRQLTHDDSWMASMLAEDPAADMALLERHPMRHALTNVVGASQRTDVHLLEETLSGGELFLLSTDGVHGELDDDRIGELMRASGDLHETASNLVAAALARGSHDNCTALVARYLA
jgi:protein phosphatase